MSELEKLLAAIESFSDSVEDFVSDSTSVEDFVSDSTSTKREFEKIASAQKAVREAITAARASIKPKVLKTNRKIDFSKAKIGDRFTDRIGDVLTFIRKDTDKSYPYQLRNNRDCVYSYTQDGKFFKGYSYSFDIVGKIS